VPSSLLPVLWMVSLFLWHGNIQNYCIGFNRILLNDRDQVGTVGGTLWVMKSAICSCFVLLDKMLLYTETIGAKAAVDIVSTTVIGLVAMTTAAAMVAMMIVIVVVAMTLTEEVATTETEVMFCVTLCGYLRDDALHECEAVLALNLYIVVEATLICCPVWAPGPKFNVTLIQLLISVLNIYACIMCE